MMSREGSAEWRQDVEERITEIETLSILRLNFMVRHLIDLIEKSHR